MNEETRKTMRQLAWVIMGVVAFFLLGQGVLVGYLYQLGPSDGSFLLRRTEAIQGWFGIQAVALAGFVLTGVAIFFGLFNFLITREASARAEETRTLSGELRRELLKTRELLANVERERAFLAVRRRAAYELYSVWLRTVTGDSTRKQVLTDGLLQVSHLFEACAAPDTREQARAGLGSYLEGDYADVVRTFLRELETVYAPVRISNPG